MDIQKATNVRARFNEIQLKIRNSHRLLNTIDTLFCSLKYRDILTAEHSVIMAEYNYKLASEFDPGNEDWYYLAALTHDIGKLSMEDNILKGSIKLVGEDRKILWNHVSQGVEILSELRMPAIIIEIARYHHERFNGSGYLEGLQKMDIPLCGRISAIADTYSALVSGRPYLTHKSTYEAVKIMIKDSHLFDPDILNSFIQMLCHEKQTMNS